MKALSLHALDKMISLSVGGWWLHGMNLGDGQLGKVVGCVVDQATSCGASLGSLATSALPTLPRMPMMNGGGGVGLPIGHSAPIFLDHHIQAAAANVTMVSDQIATMSAATGMPDMRMAMGVSIAALSVGWILRKTAKAMEHGIL